MTAGANGCCFFPFWAFGLGIGLGAAVTAAASGPKYVYPVYSYPYASPPYGYYYAPRPAYSHPAPAAPAQPAPGQTDPAQTAPEPDLQAHAWVPSSPGAGRWVPDPHPYRYVQSNEGLPIKLVGQVYPMTVSTISSPGGVTVHVIQ